ncbi:MAG: GNAT family N-acetyltransferase [Oscillospiraceae bacterium]|nr:GNAT family N-acetyltransferase [Oscillospiraceae bacterium]
MLTFTPITAADVPLLRRYYERCTYRLCEYTAGTKLMWSGYLHPAYAEARGCLIVRNCIEGAYCFDLPVPKEDGDVDGALTALEEYCTRTGLRPVISAVPEEEAARLVRRYPCLQVKNLRAWKDYLYRADVMASFAGRHYSGQRNHIHRFEKEYPDACFVELTPSDRERLEQFWAAYEGEFHKEAALARQELTEAKRLAEHLGEGWLTGGALRQGERLLAVCFAEQCGDTLVIHAEKALYSCPGAYPALVRAFAAHRAEGCTWINREDDARDKGLRISKLQYLPQELGAKFHVTVGTELDDLARVPTVETARLTLGELRPEDQKAYNALCLDDERNRWWGYDYRQDLQGELTEDYFLTVARQDFQNRLAVNFAVRLEGKLIGEAVLYHFDWKGGAELGCRIAPEYAGNGYGTEAFAAAADWALYRLGLACVTAKCYRENVASHKMLASCMRPAGEDDTFYYFTKTV